MFIVVVCAIIYRSICHFIVNCGSGQFRLGVIRKLSSRISMKFFFTLKTFLDAFLFGQVFHYAPNRNPRKWFLKEKWVSPLLRHILLSPFPLPSISLFFRLASPWSLTVFFRVLLSRIFLQISALTFRLFHFVSHFSLFCVSSDSGFWMQLVMTATPSLRMRLSGRSDCSAGIQLVDRLVSIWSEVVSPTPPPPPPPF